MNWIEIGALAVAVLVIVVAGFRSGRSRTLDLFPSMPPIERRPSQNPPAGPSEMSGAGVPVKKTPPALSASDSKAVPEPESESSDRKVNA